MVVLSVTNCPQQLRGDLTKWFIEIDIGVYVGKINARVRENLWKRVCNNIKTGKAVMIYSNNTEQGFSILTHNTMWTPIDCEGVWLMQKKKQDMEAMQRKELKKGFSKASKYANIKRNGTYNKLNRYVILDVETTGLDYELDRVIEVGMIKVENDQIIDDYQRFIHSDKKIPAEIISLTGITEGMIDRDGISESQVLNEIKKFIAGNTVVGYNVQFDISFIEKMCERQSFNNFIFKCKDILRISRRKLQLANYKLETVARACGVEIVQKHRALEDCKIIYRIKFEKKKF